jgi:hypothetical protein
MKCPKCGKCSRVLETRGYQRKRQCPDGHRYWTDEVVIETATDVHDLRDWSVLKAQAKQLLLEEEKKPKVIASDLSLGIQTVYRWRREWLNF